MRRVLSGGVCAIISACTPAAPRNVADKLPELIGLTVPFRYPSDLYEQRVQGDVTLRVFVDSTGKVIPESLRVAESSGVAALDSAAMDGAPQLLFRPALFRGRKVPLTVLFPVKFRVPSGTRTPADSGVGAAH